MNLEWLIVGGGIHGVHVAARLLGEAEVDPKGLRILDPADQLLSCWRANTATTGMTHLRSPVVHHIDSDPWSLDRFAGRRSKRESGLFKAPYNRPALHLFNSHCDQVIEQFGLADLHLQDRAESCTIDEGGAVVQLAGGQQIVAQKIVLAIGAGSRLNWPSWAPKGTQQVCHIFEPGSDAWPSTPQTVAVVGGGISACQVALRLVDEGNKVHLISRHALRTHQFDSEPGWLGPKYMAGFSREQDLGRRRARITEARHRGSVPPDVQRSTRNAIVHGRVHWHQVAVDDLSVGRDGVTLMLANNSELSVDRVLLATGYAGGRPGGQLVDALVTSAQLPCAPCGYPVVDSELLWHPRIYVSGALAELEIGPVSRNISGARRAADRMVASVLRQRASTRKAS